MLGMRHNTTQKQRYIKGSQKMHTSCQGSNDLLVKRSDLNYKVYYITTCFQKTQKKKRNI